ncbi:hypothetical protein GFS24_01015 [Chitinophaga sp. SYP-B3965]|uniref:hypothetical protein n=1 Tax=Chitinophaga sp. SYP-B3965 TaxID=2663120 RepID=UPI001299EDAC|nr:hypothetical protein [Chitinophaga sp. SYP-B3965]MRG43670.1 hypothetical protein [Chitinophaga sp. SYP-B3965]
MSKNQIILITLAIIMAIGVFMPLINIPFFGSLNFYMNGEGDGVYVLLCAGIAAIFSLTKYQKLVIIPGLVATIILLMLFMNYQDAYSNFQKIPTNNLGLFRELGESVKSAVSLNFGFIVMVIGALGLTFLPLSLSDNVETTSS